MIIYYDDKEFNDIQIFHVYLLKKYLTKHYGEDSAKKLIVAYQNDLLTIAKELGSKDIAFFAEFFLTNKFVCMSTNTLKPLGKVHLKLVVPHVLIIEFEIFLVIAAGRLLTHPQIFHFIVPGTPESLIHRRTGGNLDRDTDAVNIQNVLVGLQHAIHIIDGHRILNLVVDMEYTELSLQIVPTNIVDTKVEQDTTVLSTRKRHTDVVKILKDNLQAFLCQFIYVLSTCTTSHTPSVLSVLYHFHIALPHIHFLESQSTKDIPILQKADGRQRALLFCRNSHNPLQQSFQHRFVTSLDIVIVHDPTALPTLYRNKADHLFPIHSDKPTVSLSGAEREIIVLLQDSRIHYQRTDTWIQCCIQSFKFQYLIHKKLLIYS